MFGGGGGERGGGSGRKAGIGTGGLGGMGECGFHSGGFFWGGVGECEPSRRSLDGGNGPRDGGWGAGGGGGSTTTGMTPTENSSAGVGGRKREGSYDDFIMGDA